jgi:hypothetical protein
MLLTIPIICLLQPVLEWWLLIKRAMKPTYAIYTSLGWASASGIYVAFTWTCASDYGQNWCPSTYADGAEALAIIFALTLIGLELIHLGVAVAATVRDKERTHMNVALKTAENESQLELVNVGSVKTTTIE